MSAALRLHLASLHPLELKELEEPYRRFDIDRMAEHFAVAADAVWAELKALRPQPAHDGFKVRFEWRRAIRHNGTLTPPEKLAALEVEDYVNSTHLYAWPPQDRMAANLGYARGPNFGRLLVAVFELGALAPVFIRNLPEELRHAAVNVSHRSLRGVAYRLYPVDQWATAAKQYEELRNSNRFRSGTLQGSAPGHLNQELNPEPASPDSSHTDTGDSPPAFQIEEPFYSRDDGRVSIGGLSR